ncbi:hypothetical protein BDV26DRAFT_296431 [Aspergillus bertholletiae]|uniref:BTB domain-containing protein n=1 Tax=Aspergillus bertholletiae TaxID=1226010 RepID=A0A5N7AYQ8_9EURO|nr:hypothetical protein BDV26DRAFT_296431 [Aspergillus bertholletiae]
MSMDTGKHILSGAIVKLDVGIPPVPFNIHRELLCEVSPVFFDLFTVRLPDLTEEHLCLRGEDPDTFAEFVNWMYWDTVFKDQHPRVLALFKLWVLADKLEIP